MEVLFFSCDPETTFLPVGQAFVAFFETYGQAYPAAHA